MQVTDAPAGRSLTASARRAQIVAAAIDTIAELGYAHASYARIAERAGLSSTRLISYHFADKRDLLAEIAGTVYQAGARYVLPRIQAERSAPGMLAACLRANLEFLRDHANQVAAVTEIEVSLRAEGKLRAPGSGPGDEQIQRGIEAILRKGQADGDFADFDVPTVAWVIRHAIDGVQQRRTREPGLDFEVCIRELTEFFRRATVRRDAS